MRGAAPGDSPTSHIASLRSTTPGTALSDSARASMRLAKRDAPKNGTKFCSNRKVPMETKSDATNAANSELNRLSALQMRSRSAGNTVTTANNKRYERRFWDCLKSVENTFCAMLAEVGTG